MHTEQPMEDILVQEYHLVRADTGKRVLNLIVDIIAFYIFAMFIGVVIAVLSPEALAAMDNPDFGLIDRILSMVLYALFMGSCEALFKGKSLGKLVTRTRAVNLDGSPISASTAFVRGFARAVPFCFLSAFGTPCNPWQDSWTNTMVIDEKTSVLQ